MLFDAAIAAQNEALQAVAGVELVLRRRGVDAGNLIGVPLATRHDNYGGDEYLFSEREQDWLIWAAEYKTGDGRVVEPLRLDEIDWIDASGRKRTFKVLPRPDDRVYRHTDQTRQQLRVYTAEQIANAE